MRPPSAEFITILRFWIFAVTVLLVVSFDGVSTNEGFFHRRSQSDQQNVKERNIINTKDKAKVMLKRYGYLRCKIGHRRRNAHTTVANNHGTETAKGNRSVVRQAAQQQQEQHPWVANWTKHCTPKELREAVRLYQRHYNMRETGRLDSATLKLMSASRCGNPDDEVGLAATVPAADKILTTDRGVARRKRSSMTLKGLVGKRPMRASLPAKLQGDTITRRKRWVESYAKKFKSGDIDKRLSTIHDEMQKRRKKRSTVGRQGKAHPFSKDVISWRLVSSAYSNQMSIQVQRIALALAFRMWSEVIPRIFYEDLNSSVDDVDILIAFGRGEHMNCANKFDGYGGQLSHAIRQYRGAEIHVDDDEFFTVGSDRGTNLQKVAVHEIGHVLGLIHTHRNYSIMYAIYSEFLPNDNFELGREDRKVVQAIYGICKGAFDTVFDWVRHRPDGQLIYNTYFFRKEHYWMYENRYSRPRYGDPLAIGPEWKGVPGNLDGFVHIWFYNQDSTLFFKDSRYWKYDSASDEVVTGYPRNISQGFGPMPNTSNEAIPDHVDTVYFDKRDDNVYFFKGNMVYGYDASKGEEGCCLPGYPRNIRDEYPSDKDSVSLPYNLDAVYYSYTDRSLYFFKGRFYWHNVAFNPLDRRRTNLVRGPFPIHNKWYDICDAEFF